MKRLPATEERVVLGEMERQLERRGLYLRQLLGERLSRRYLRDAGGEAGGQRGVPTQLMVDQAFSASKDPAGAQVLDPAYGAGIFLALAFRRLVSERWLRDEERPNYRIIQEILYKQLRGFDVSEPAPAEVAEVPRKSSRHRAPQFGRKCERCRQSFCAGQPAR